MSMWHSPGQKAVVWQETPDTLLLRIAGEDETYPLYCEQPCDDVQVSDAGRVLYVSETAACAGGGAVHIIVDTGTFEVKVATALPARPLLRHSSDPGLWVACADAGTAEAQVHIVRGIQHDVDSLRSVSSVPTPGLSVEEMLDHVSRTFGVSF